MTTPTSADFVNLSGWMISEYGSMTVTEWNTLPVTGMMTMSAGMTAAPLEHELEIWNLNPLYYARPITAASLPELPNLSASLPLSSEWPSGAGDYPEFPLLEVEDYSMDYTPEIHFKFITED